MRNKVLIILCAAALGVGVLFYVALRSTNADVTARPPYASVMNTALTTNTRLTLAKNLPQFVVSEPYFLTADTQLFEGVEKVAELPAGTVVQFQRALHHTGGVSGVTSSFLIGEVEANGARYRVEFNWGEHHPLCTQAPCGYWTFPQAPWQSSADTNKYFFE